MGERNNGKQLRAATLIGEFLSNPASRLAVFAGHLFARRNFRSRLFHSEFHLREKWQSNWCAPILVGVRCCAARSLDSAGGALFACKTLSEHFPSTNNY